MTRRARGATARPAARRIAAGAGPRVAARGAPGPNTGGHVGPVGGQCEPDVDVRVELAAAFELAAAGIRQNGLAWFASRLAPVLQPHGLAPMPNPDPNDALLTADDLAARLRCNRRTLRRWRHLGVVPKPIEIAGALRWRPGDVDRWLAGGKP